MKTSIDKYWERVLKAITSDGVERALEMLQTVRLFHETMASIPPQNMMLYHQERLEWIDECVRRIKTGQHVQSIFD